MYELTLLFHSVPEPGWLEGQPGLAAVKTVGLEYNPAKKGMKSTEMKNRVAVKCRL